MPKNLLSLLITLLIFGTIFYFVFSRFRKQDAKNICKSQQPQFTIQNQLYSLMHGDIEASHRLIQMAKRNKSGMTEEWYWEKAIDDLMHDRR